MSVSTEFGARCGTPAWSARLANSSPSHNHPSDALDLHLARLGEGNRSQARRRGTDSRHRRTRCPPGNRGDASETSTHYLLEDSGNRGGRVMMAAVNEDKTTKDADHSAGDLKKATKPTDDEAASDGADAEQGEEDSDDESSIKPAEGKTDIGPKFGQLSEIVAYAGLQSIIDSAAQLMLGRLTQNSVVLIVRSRDQLELDLPAEEVRGLLDLNRKLLHQALEAATAAIETNPDGAVSGAVGGRDEGDQGETGVRKLAFRLSEMAGPGGDLNVRGILPLVPIAPIVKLATTLLPLAASAVKKVTFEGVSNVVQKAVGLLAWFKRDIVVTDAEVTIDQDAVENMMANALADPNDSRVIYCSVEGTTGSGSSELFDSYLDGLALRTAAMAARELLHTRAVEPFVRQTKVLDDLLAVHKTSAARRANKTQIDTEQSTLEQIAAATAGSRALYETLGQLVAGWDKLDESLVKPTAAGGPPPLVASMRRERIRRSVRVGGDERPVTHMLSLKVVSANGDAVTQKGPFVIEGKVGFIAGVQITWLLTAMTGQVVAGGSRGSINSLSYNIAADEPNVLRALANAV
jgi:hypothetical protein